MFYFEKHTLKCTVSSDVPFVLHNNESLINFSIYYEINFKLIYDYFFL